MCQFAITSKSCQECRSLWDCLDESQPLHVAPSQPRTDAPLKVIKPHCRTRRPREVYAR